MLKEKLGTLPRTPGVYLFKDFHQKPIYIGKAKSLRHRVRSYFQSNLDHKTEILKSFICDLDYIVTDTELEALFLESNLVKKYKPKFNVNLKDDKTFLHIKMTTQENFPRVLLTRRIVEDGSSYFGPFYSPSLARNTIKIINRHFLLRTCDLHIDGSLDHPCLEYHMKRCLGPCAKGLCTHQDYSQAVKDTLLFLGGKNKQLLTNLKSPVRRLISPSIASIPFCAVTISHILKPTCRERRRLRITSGMGFMKNSGTWFTPTTNCFSRRRSLRRTPLTP